ncbi:DUF1345 domain-containing protein [Paractinoplanes lichenicola]|uniref:DUF1345 domain-containing protein n=1 Tax=Paractinoplanes lichenicola TaxID=2802976 RepID=A0ABS1VM05_9ACTN|nr:DUF1345 domain-containing protein [Actinoplanes lichenicola]MBL7255757.1 DUF1345 domain-containing protein [Actinoplanes lichenicola]
MPGTHPLRWWTRESSRQFLSLPFFLFGLLLPGDYLVKWIAGWDFYATAYLTLTWLTYRRRDPAVVRAIALASRRQTTTDRLLATAPEQFSQAAASVAMVTTVVAMPQARDLGTSPGLVLLVSIVAVVTCWLVLQTGFAIAYLGMYAQRGGLSFPGDAEPGIVDFAYFSVAVGTSFGTTDVEVTQTRIRRQVLVHGVSAFLFNTLILAVAVTILTTYISKP